MKRLILLALVSLITLGVSAQNASKNEQTVTIQTNGVCQKCADKFKENVPYFKGVKSYSYDMKTSKLTINYDAKKTNPDQLRKEVSKLGYNADNVKADEAARAKLPACCKVEKGKSGCGGCAGHGNGQGCGNHQSGAKSCSGHGSSQSCGNHQSGTKSCANHKAAEKSCSGQANAKCSEQRKDCSKSCGGHIEQKK